MGSVAGLGESPSKGAAIAGPAWAEIRPLPCPGRTLACRGLSLPGTRTRAVPAQRSERGQVPRNHARTAAEMVPARRAGHHGFFPSLAPRPAHPPDTAPSPPASALGRKSGQRLDLPRAPPPRLPSAVPRRTLSPCRLPPFCRSPSFLQNQTRIPPRPVTETRLKTA